MKRLKEVEVNGKKFIFDGNIVKIYEVKDYAKEDFYNEKELNAHRTNYLHILCLVLNNTCNLACDYCFANKGKYDKPNEQMDWSVAKKAIDVLANTVIENSGSNMTISFFGGEPLLSFEFIKKIVQYNKLKYPNIYCTYMITTNATLIDKEKALYMENNKFDIMVSIDGNEKMHNQYRKYLNGCGSYTDVIDGINKFSNKSILNARITITDANADIVSYISDILELGFKRITFAVDYNISETNFEIFITSLKKLIEKYLMDIQNNKFYEITNFSRVIINIALNQRNLSHCNAGISYLAVSADGKYYRCPRFVGHSKFSLGNVKEDIILQNKLKEFKKNVKDNPTKRNIKCRKCKFVYLCGGMCYHHAYMSKLNEFESVQRECIEKITIFEGIIEFICKLSVKERRKLLLFYTNLWKAI